MRLVHALLATTLLGLSPALAADPESCQTIRLSDPGWTDITSTNSIAATLLDRARLRPRGQDPLGARSATRR